MPSQLFSGHGIPLVTSAARTTSNNSGNLKDTTLQVPVAEAVSFILDVTAMTGSGTTLDVQIDTSPDGGTTWYRAWAFARVTTSTSQQRIDVRPTGVGITEVGSTVASLAATTAINANTVVTRDVRVSWTAGTSFSSSTFAVWAIYQPMGTRGF